MNTFKPKLNKISILLLFLLSSSTFCYSQVDTVIIDNRKIACAIKEITPDAVKFTYPGEDVINSVYKNTVQKIIFKSGRVQTFAESTSYKSVTNAGDYNNVTITSVETEVKGLYKIIDVSSSAKGGTVFSNQEKIKGRAYDKMKMQAAMFGANIIYLTNQQTETAKYNYFGSTMPETDLTGIAYSNVLPDYENFKKLIGTKTTFNAIQEFKLGRSDNEVSQDTINQLFMETSTTNENGVIFVYGKIKGNNQADRFQLVNFDNSSFTMAYKYKGNAYSFVIEL